MKMRENSGKLHPMIFTQNVDTSQRDLFKLDDTLDGVEMKRAHNFLALQANSNLFETSLDQAMEEDNIKRAKGMKLLEPGNLTGRVKRKKVKNADSNMVTPISTARTKVIQDNEKRINGSDIDLKSNYMHIPKDVSNSQFRGLEADESESESWEYDDEVAPETSSQIVVNSRNLQSLSGSKTTVI